MSLKRVKTSESECFLEIHARCRRCGFLIGDCIIKDEKGDRPLGYHKFKPSAVDITREEINLLPISACRSCQREFWRGISKKVETRPKATA